VGKILKGIGAKPKTWGKGHCLVLLFLISGFMAL